MCHVGFGQDQQPLVIPALHAHLGETLLLHGAKGGRLAQACPGRQSGSAAFTLLDGIVLARSAFHHSVNYRSVVLFGRGKAVEGDEEKLRALEAITEHVAKGRWQKVRRPNRKELAATAVVAIEIETASAKVRSGPPIDDEEDYQLPIWAGVLPLAWDLKALSVTHGYRRRSAFPTISPIMVAAAFPPAVAEAATGRSHAVGFSGPAIQPHCNFGQRVISGTENGHDRPLGPACWRRRCL